MSRTKSTKHWHAMNGSSGCMPDNNEVHTSKKNAVESLCSSFDYLRGMQTALRQTGIFYFPIPAEAGADYAEITECNEPDCLQE